MGCIVIRNRLVDRILGKWSGSSFILGVVFLKTTAPDCILKHEMQHQIQIRRYGQISFWFLYVYQVIKYGYYNAPLEIEARDAENE